MKHRLITIMTVLLTVCSVCAQTITIDDCVRMANNNYPAIAQYELIDKVAAYNLSNASKAWLPQGNIYIQGTWQNDVSALPEALTLLMAQQGVNYPGIGKWQYKAGADVNQQIWDGGRVKANRHSIETGAEVEKANLDVQMYDVEGRVQELYFSLLLLDSRIERADKSIGLVNSTLRQVKAMFANGVAMQSDCDQIEARLLTAQQQKAQLVASRDSYRRILEIFIGEKIGSRQLLLPDGDGSQSLVASNPQLRLFDARLRNLDAQEQSIRTSSMPTFGAFASAYYGYPGYNMFNSMRSKNLSFNLMVGINLTWNFSSLYTRRNSLDKVRTQRNQVETDRATFLFNNCISENDAMGQISSLRDVMERDEKIVRLNHSVMRAAQSQLHNGVIDATTLLSKITDEELAENDLILHRIELVKAIYNLTHIRNK